MPASRLIMGDTANFGATGAFQPLATGRNTVASSGITTETQAQVTYRSAGNFTNLYVNCAAWSTTTQSIRTRKAAANATLVVSVNAAGIFEDTSHTDAVAAADKWDISTAVGNAATSISAMAVTYTANSNTVTRAGAITSTSGEADTSASTTLFYSLAGALNQTATEANAQKKMYKAGTLKNAYVNVKANTNTNTSTVHSRLANVNKNLSIAVGASGTTGVIEDTSNTDTVAVNDLWNFGYTTGAATVNITFTVMGCDFISTAGDSFGQSAASGAGGIGIAGTGDNPMPIGGGQNYNSAEGGIQVLARSAFTCNNLSMNIRTNTFTTGTIKFRKNGANGNQSAAAGASTGEFVDTTNTDLVATGDNINVDLVSTGTGQIVFNNTGVFMNLPAGVFYPNFFSTIGLRPKGTQGMGGGAPGQIGNTPPIFSTY